MLNQLILSIFPSVDLGEVALLPLKKPRDLPKATWREVVVLRIGSVYLESKHIVMFTKLCCFPRYNPLTWKNTLREWCLARGSVQTVPASGTFARANEGSLECSLHQAAEARGWKNVGKKLWSLQFIKSACSWHNVNFFLDSNRSRELWYSVWQNSALQHGYW